MENEILLATSDGFYYQGVPSTATYVKEEYKENTLSDSYKTDENLTISKIVGRAVDVVTVFFVFLGIILIIKGISNFRKNKKMLEEYNELSDDAIKLDGSKKIRKKAVLLYFIFSIVLFFHSFILYIAKNYASN